VEKTDNLFLFGPFEVDSLARTLKRDGTAVALNRRAFDVLLHFVRNPGRVIPKDEILRSIWPDTSVDENSLAQSVSVLRRALDEKPGDNSYIVTLPGRGYQFISRVRTVSTEQAPPVPDVPPATAPADPAFRLPKWLLAGLVAALAVIAAYSLSRHRRAPQQPIAVVLADLENSTGDPDFDRIFNRALVIDLEQSPFLNLLPRPKIQETLAEMQRPRDSAVTPALAREICERNNAQAVLHGALSRFGGSYLLLLDAEGCLSGERLGGYKTQIASKDGLLAALDAGAARLRRQLGESGASRERFQVPIAQATTPSLEALLDYTRAGESYERGDSATALRLLEHAIAVDPKFATAYKSLGSTYYNRADLTQAAIYFKRAFELRQRTTERERLTIEIAYYAFGIFDLEAAIRSMTLFNLTYPNSAANWGNLCNLYTQLGQYAEAIDAGEHARKIDSQSGFAAVVLARAYKRANRFAEAKAQARAAVALGKNLPGAHSILFQIAFAEHDPAALETEGQWGLSHQNAASSLDDLAFAAAAGGRLREAIDTFSRARTEALRVQDPEFADAVLLDLAGVLVEFGKLSQAAAALRSMKGASSEPDWVAILKARTGDPAAALRIVSTVSPVTETNTVHLYFHLPQLRATLSLMAHQPAEAVRALDPARPYQLRNFRVPYLRARAEAEAGMLDAATRDYRLILENQGVDPIAPVYSLSHLRLARVRALQKQFAQARNEYRALFSSWEHADPDLDLLIQAQREYRALPSPGL